MWFKNKVKARLLDCLPARCLTWVAGRLASCRLGFLSSFVIKRFIKSFSVNMQEAKISDYRKFACFNDFFTRQLQAGARLVDSRKNALVSPVDGTMGWVGPIRSNVLLQAKGRFYDLAALLAYQQKDISAFSQGAYFTAYLSPKDYHRVHMPIDGQLMSMTWVPGSLFSVQPAVLENTDSVFARNERVICIFNTAIGRLAVIFVGATIVGSMATAWHGVVKPKRREISRWDYAQRKLHYHKGEEIGFFQLGSTVIVLTQQGQVDDVLMQEGDVLKMGQAIATTIPNQS
jgi:phosphatidylserine decarboxylase